MSQRGSSPRPSRSWELKPKSITVSNNLIRGATSKKQGSKKLEDVQVVQVTERNVNSYYKWLEDQVDAIQFTDVLRPIKGKKLEGRGETLSLVEFKGGTTLENILAVMEACPNLEKLLFNGVQLESYPRTYGNHFTVMVKELVFFGYDRLTKDETYIISYFNRRINLPALQSVVFQTKKMMTNVANVPGTGVVEQAPSSSATKKTHPPPNDTTNSVNTSVVSALMIKCAESLRSLEAKRKIFLMSPTDKTEDASLVQLERFVCDMSNTGFERILNVQRNLRVLICFNSTALPVYTFEAVIVCVERCERTLTDIKIRHKFLFKNEFRNPLLGRSPASVIHDCRMYAACHKLKTLHLDLSSLSKQQEKRQKKKKKKQQQQEHLLPHEQRDQEDVKAVTIIGLASIPFSLKLLTIRFDVIDDKEMSSFAERFPHFLSLVRLILEGNPATPFLMKPRWITSLLQLPLLQLFEFHHYRVSEDNSQEWRKLKGEIAKIGNNSFLTSDTCICWRRRQSEDSDEVSATNI